MWTAVFANLTGLKRLHFFSSEHELICWNPFFKAVGMKCLKVEEYIKRTASAEKTELLRQELKVSLITNPF